MARGSSKGTEASDRPPGGRAVWRRAAGLLEAGQFERATTHFQTARGELEEEGDQMGAAVLAAAAQMCVSCRRAREEVDAHRRAWAAAAKREETVRRELLALLALAAGQETTETGASAPAAADGPATVPTLWERILRLFERGREGETEAAQTAKGVESVEAPVPEEAAGARPGRFRHGEIAPPANESTLPVPDGAALTVYTLGAFRVYQAEQLVEEWPSLKGQSIFKYLVAHRGRPVNKEVLMDLFWPDADPESARNNLNVAIYGLRQAFRQIDPELSYVIFRDNVYLLNPELHIWIDIEAFRERFTRAKQFEQRGELAAATAEYHAAEALYEGDFLEEDRYEDWLLPLRRQLRKEYLEALSYLSLYYFEMEDYGACITLCRQILEVDRCREEAYQLYMRSCHRQGQRYLALRQYHRCEEALEQELEAKPSQSTMELYERIRQSQSP